jgi:hypothetical protein
VTFRTAGACLLGLALLRPALAQSNKLPRTPGGKPDLQGIWQVRNRAAYDLEDHHAGFGMLAGEGVVEGNTIPYQPAAAAQKAKNFANRQTQDPASKCYMPGVPRIMYMNYAFQIFQTPSHIAMAFELSHIYRMIYTNGSKHPEGLDFWMGDSRGRWEGDTLVVDVTNHNPKTWFDMAGNFHSDTLHVVERYSLTDADTLRYEVTIEDPKTFTRPWKISMPIYRQKEMRRLPEYACQAEAEETAGDFTRDPHTWYPAGKSEPTRAAAAPPIRRATDGKPNLEGYYSPQAPGANYGLEEHKEVFGFPEGPGFIIDPLDKKLPMQDWAKAEQQDRLRPERGYEDPTAHCFASGVPRSMYTSSFQIVQTPGYVVFFFERMAHRIVPLDWRPHAPDHVRLWHGDSVGHWEGNTLVVETTNFNGKSWLNEVGEIVSYAETVVERFTPVDRNTIDYQATVTDPLVYTRPWTIAFLLKKQQQELLEVACLEDNQDLKHLKDVRDAAIKAKSSSREDKN